MFNPEALQSGRPLKRPIKRDLRPWNIEKVVYYSQRRIIKRNPFIKITLDIVIYNIYNIRNKLRGGI